MTSTCAICNKSFATLVSLGKHLHFSHPEIAREQYYQQHIATVSSTCECGEKKKFRNLGEGYRKWCSESCSAKFSIERRKINCGRKQSEQHIAQRVEHTDQAAKEKRRKSTMQLRYGVDNPTKVPEFQEAAKQTSLKNWGVPYPTQNRELMFARGGFKGNSWKDVEVDGIQFRVQGYEPLFLRDARDLGFPPEELVSHSGVPHVDYQIDDKPRRYFADFYHQSSNTLIEVKSTWTWKQGGTSVQRKIDAASEAGFNVLVVIYVNARDKSPTLKDVQAPRPTHVPLAS